MCGLSAATFQIPRPDGPYGTNFAVAALVDTSRLDPFAPKPEYRRTVISAFYPLAEADNCQWEVIPAYPSKSAAIFDDETAFAGVPNGTFEAVRLEVCNPTHPSQCSTEQWPLILFSPGLGLSRLWYSGLAQSFASHGFVVVTVDHPYDADVVEFPNGRIITAINSTWNHSQIELDNRVRVDDVKFVLDELSKPDIFDKLDPTYGARFALNRTGVMGK